MRGAVFEELARIWVRRHAASNIIGGSADYVGPSTIALEGKARRLALVVSRAEDPAAPPSERSVVALGEAKEGATLDRGHLRALEKARAALGTIAVHAVLLLFGPAFAEGLQAEVAGRADVELIGLERLYEGD